MAAIWGPENRYRKWLDIELLACEAMAERGEIPKESLQNHPGKGRIRCEQDR